jgi:ribokinase
MGALIVDESGATHVSAKPVAAIDTSGAGDAFIGTLAHLMARCPSMPLLAMSRRACDVSTISVAREGTQKSYPTLADLPADFMSTEAPGNN